MDKIFIVTSKTNTPIIRTIPWASSKLETRTLGVKEFVYYNFIENIEDTLKITIKNNENIKCEIKIEKGTYDLDYILAFIKISLKKYKTKSITFTFNKSTGKIEISNDSTYVINLNTIACKFFNLPAFILPHSFIKSYKTFNICESNSIYVRIKHLKNGMYSDVETNHYGEIVFQSTLRGHPREKIIDLVTCEKPIQYEFFNKNIETLEIHITDENGKYVNLQNIKIVFYFKTEIKYTK